MRTLDEFSGYVASKYYTTRKSVYFSWKSSHFANHEQLKLSLARSIAFCDRMLRRPELKYAEQYEEERSILIGLWNYLMEKK